MEGTNKAHENGEAMGLVGVRLTAQLGRAHFLVQYGSVIYCAKKKSPTGALLKLPLPLTLLLRKQTWQHAKRSLLDLVNKIRILV